MTGLGQHLQLQLTPRLINNCAFLLARIFPFHSIPHHVKPAKTLQDIQWLLDLSSPQSKVRRGQTILPPMPTQWPRM